MTMLDPITPVAETPQHPVVWFADRAHAVLDQVLASGVYLSSLSPAATAEAIVSLGRLADRVEALMTSLLPHADILDVAATGSSDSVAESVATSTPTWFATATRTPVGPARRQVHVAKQLDAVYQRTQDAALTGGVNPAQVQVIVDALDRLPAWVSAEQRVQAEEHLIDLAGSHDARRLRLLARHLLHVIDPDAADAELAGRLEREEADAARTTMFTMREDGRGTCHGRFRIPAVHGAMLSVALDALASPRRPDAIEREVPAEPTDATDSGAADPGEVVAAMRTRTAPEVLGAAFCELIERFPTKKLPRSGGGLATVLVTIDLTTLETGLGVATLSTGGHLTAGAARRLACQAGIIPAVLGSKSQVLDLGRKIRLHTESQRIAMTLRDKTCTAEGCTIPAARCHAHHVIPWSEGGTTTVKDGRLVCPRHHRLIHHPCYQTDYLPNGKIRVVKARTVRRQ